MYLKTNFSHKQRGSMLVVALFIIIVISLLAASLAKILSSSADGIANEVYSAKAIYAAESAMEFGMYKALVDSECEGKANRKELPVDSETGLENCKATYVCETVILNDASGQFLYSLESTGTCGREKFVAEHKVEAEVKL